MVGKKEISRMTALIVLAVGLLGFTAGWLLGSLFMVLRRDDLHDLWDEG